MPDYGYWIKSKKDVANCPFRKTPGTCYHRVYLKQRRARLSWSIATKPETYVKHLQQLEYETITEVCDRRKPHKIVHIQIKQRLINA